MRDQKRDGLFFGLILATLLGSTIFAGATAVVLATGAYNVQTVDVAQLP